MDKPRILITGSKGTIGRILAEALSGSFDVYGLDIVVAPSERDYRADISNYDELDKVFKEIGRIELVIHLASESRVDADWESVLKNNIIGTRNVYECARKYGVRQVILASSNHVTGAYEGLPPALHRQANPPKVSITDPVRPDSDYGTSKVFGEAVARQYFELYGIRSICLRIGGVLRDDDPTRDDRDRKIWLSHRDLIQLVRKSLVSDIGFGVYYGVSSNKGMFWEIANAREEIGYEPEDDASVMK